VAVEKGSWGEKKDGGNKLCWQIKGGTKQVQTQNLRMDEKSL